jgi:ATP-binding cassette subfamily B protein
MEFVRVYTRVLDLLGPDKRLGFLLALANVALAGLQFLEPVLFGRVIDVLSGSSGRPSDEVWNDSLRLLGIWVAVGLGGIFANIAVALHADRMAHRRRLAAMTMYFEHVLSLPLAFHGHTHSGRLLKIMFEGVDHLFGIWLAFFREHLATFVALIILVPLSLWLNWRLGLVLLALAVLFAWLSVLVMSRTERAQGRVQEYHSELAGRAGDALGNVGLIQSYVRLALEVQQLNAVAQRVLQAQFPVLTWWAVVTVMTRTAATLTVITIFVLGTLLHLQGLATVGEIVSFMGFATLLIGRLEQAMGFASRLFFQMHGIAQFFDVLDTRSGVTEKPGALEFGRVHGDVRFDGVTLSYDGKRPAIADLSFEAKAGAMVALVGPTGAGKTTAMAMLHRLWDPQQGRITIDGTDIRDVTLASLRKNIGVVFQDSTMFHRSIADNLRVGRPDASDEDMQMAARLAQAHDFIMAQPDGYTTLVGERGATLSGGERQRLAIARALLKDPPILILDEATSALDAMTEERVQLALKQLMKGRTTFVIAHRLSTIRDADLVLVMEQGRIVEMGSYRDLLQKGGAFARLVSTQQGGALPV